MALLALARINHARYGTNAATKDSALGPCQAPDCTLANNALSSSATEEYSVLNEFQAPAAANNDPGPGPVLNRVECTSGGAAMKMGAVIVSPGRRHTMPPRRHRPRHNWRRIHRHQCRSDRALLHLGPPLPHARRRAC